jgi:hypothetical protein
MSKSDAESAAPRGAERVLVKLACGHRVEAKPSRDGETAYCPICKRELFTGWPEHMEEAARTAERLKKAAGEYLDQCIETGVAPRLAAIVGACESILTGVSFEHGRQRGSAIDAD